MQKKLSAGMLVASGMGGRGGADDCWALLADKFGDVAVAGAVTGSGPELLLGHFCSIVWALDVGSGGAGSGPGQGPQNPGRGKRYSCAWRH
jgi:hypothetical protein